MTDRMKPCPNCNGSKLNWDAYSDGKGGRAWFIFCLAEDCQLAGPAHLQREIARDQWQNLPRHGELEDLKQRTERAIALAEDMHDELQYLRGFKQGVRTAQGDMLDD